jgi:hypothetical protein
MPFKSGNFIIQNNSNRMALITEVNNNWIKLFWTDICREIDFPLQRAQYLIEHNKWKYVET